MDKGLRAFFVNVNGALDDSDPRRAFMGMFALCGAVGVALWALLGTGSGENGILLNHHLPMAQWINGSGVLGFGPKIRDKIEYEPHGAIQGKEGRISQTLKLCTVPTKAPSLILLELVGSNCGM